MITTGNCIYLWRIKQGMRQKDLVQKSGIPQPNLSDIEREKVDPTVTTLRHLALALGTTPGTLADGKPPEGKPAGLSTGRASLERIARAVFNQKIRIRTREKVIVRQLRIVVPLKGTRRPSQQQVHLAWISLRHALGQGALKSLLSRVEDQRRRMS